MAKADDLKALVVRLLTLKDSAVLPTEEWAKPLAAQGATIAKLDALQVWYYDSTLPAESTFPAPPVPSLGIEVREGERMNLVLRIHVQDGQLERGTLKANTWKRGPWEKALATTIAA